MALMLLFWIGVMAGWIASIITRDEEPRAIRRQIAIALLASLTIGLITNGGTVLGSLSWIAAGAALVGSVAGLAGYNVYRSRKSDSLRA